MNVDMAKRLADRRRQAGLTQEGLAEKLNVTRQAVSKWERSESSPDTDNLIALAALYDVSLDELLYSDVEEFTAEVDIACEASPAKAGNGSPIPPQGQTTGADNAPTPNRAAGSAGGAAGAFNPRSEARSESAGCTPGVSGGQDGGCTPGVPGGQDAGSASGDSNEQATPNDAGFGFNSNDGNVHIGPDGIHVEDGKDYVHINWRDGVNVVDGKKGDHVHVGWDGIHVNDRSYDNLGDANRALGADHFWGPGPEGSGKAALRFPFPALVIIAYILAGIFLEAWGPALFLFFLIPLYYLIVGLATTKKLGPFLAGLYPLGAVAWFCWMAFLCNNAHPAWVIFLTIPLAEWAIVATSHWWRRRKKAKAA